MVPGLRHTAALAVVVVVLFTLQMKGAPSRDLTQAHRRLACKWNNWNHKMTCGKPLQNPAPKPPQKPLQKPRQKRPPKSSPNKGSSQYRPIVVNSTVANDNAAKGYFFNQAKLHSRSQLTTDGKNELCFVHATKTGGTALNLHMMTNGEQCPMLHFFVGHSFREHELQEHGYQSLVILREPSDRIRSSFDYAKYGSTFHGTSTVTNDAKLFDDANDFVDALRNGSHALHKTAWSVVEHREGGIQFKPEEHWLNGDPSRRSAVCYSGDLGSSVSQAVNLHMLGSALPDNPSRPLCNITIPRSNVSSKRSANLDELNANWIRLESMYASDFNLWRHHCDAGLPYPPPPDSDLNVAENSENDSDAGTEDQELSPYDADTTTASLITEEEVRTSLSTQVKVVDSGIAALASSSEATEPDEESKKYKEPKPESWDDMSKEERKAWKKENKLDDH